MVVLNSSLVLLWLLLVMLLVRLAQRLWSLHPEHARKTVHILLGLTTLAFPWLFSSPWPVLVLGLLAGAFLLAVRFWRPLQTRLGPVLGSVGRESFGEIYFPISVALIFWLANGNWLFFVIPVALLTIPDAFAALVGVRYGTLPYQATEGKKTVEGSTAFFALAFLSVHVPLLLCSNIGRAETLLIGMIIAALCMLIEAFSWKGIDNLLVPVGGFALLNAYESLDAGALLWRFGVTVLLVMFALFFRRRTTLNDAALLGSAFIGYLSLAVGGWQWFLPTLVFFLSYRFLTPDNPIYEQRPHTFHALVSVVGPGLVWLAIGTRFGRAEFLFPYLVAMASSFAMVGTSGLLPEGWRKMVFGRKGLAFLAAGLAYFAIFAAILHEFLGPLRWSIPGGLLLTLLASVTYAAVHSMVELRWPRQGSWVSRGLLACAGSGIAALWVWYHPEAFVH